jgi:murein L,D-transpeptidase YafK
MNEVFTLADEALRDGQTFFRVHVFPFRMTDKRMEKEWARQPKWIEFWANLKEGYDFFENANFPPSVQVGSKEYVFRLP